MKRTGFTLIELVVVLVVIGFLAAIAIPRFVDLTAQAKRASEEGTVGAVRAGIMLFYAASSPTKAFPASLNGPAAPADCGPAVADQCFGNVTEPVTQGGADGWSRCTATAFRGPNGGCYNYIPATGRFELSLAAVCVACP
ncbi:MAG: type II secretion system protein [Candidatus Omnitrophica bacterium]|nr:type II secretion system protein [Candidatus Omnitrophota bacterium]